MRILIKNRQKTDFIKKSWSFVVSKSEEDEGTRRDFLFYATGGVAAVGTGAAVWPLINQMNPSADVKALSSIRVDVSDVEPGTQLTVKWLGNCLLYTSPSPRD